MLPKLSAIHSAEDHDEAVKELTEYLQREMEKLKSIFSDIDWDDSWQSNFYKLNEWAEKFYKEMTDVD